MMLLLIFVRLVNSFVMLNVALYVELCVYCIQPHYVYVKRHR